MAPNLEELKRTFFDECTELMQEIESGLGEIREGGGSEDTVHAVFRAVHSVKGGAGIFGFDTLVGFAHVFETVLDAVRHGTLAPEPSVIDVLLTSSDVLSDLVGMARAGEAIPPDYGSECRASLEQLIGSDGSDEVGGEPAGDFDGLEFVPLRADAFDDVPAEEGKRCFAITFRPMPEMLKNANEPLYIVRELRKLGTVNLVAETQTLPPLSELQADYPYIGWTGTIETTATREEVEEVFEFVVGDCELEITEVGTVPGAAAEIAEADTPVQVVQEEMVPLVPSAEEDKPAPSMAAGEGAETTKTTRAPAKAAATTTRVDLDKIDRVVNLVGELVIAQAQLGQVVQTLPEEASGRLFQILEEVLHHTRELKDSVMSMRAQPVSAVFQRMPRLVRELSMKTGKRVRLEMSGENTEVDRTIIERLSDPLTHIIRNSVDHGIESADDRMASGKSEEGTIHLSADHRGGRIVIEVRDDGAGINSERVLKKAREKGLVEPDAVLTEDEISNLVFLPGFSTADTISDISGRGVGMDVVRRNIQDLGGRIWLKSERGRGTTIQLALPLTLAVMDGMVVKVGRETYVLPLASIVECLRPARSDVHNLLGTRGMLRLRGDLVPLVHLSELLDLGPTTNDLGDRVIIITEAGEGVRFGLVVDELCGHQQVVIKSIEESYGTVPGIAAATILGNGRVAFILDVEKVSELAVEGSQMGAAVTVNGNSMASATVN
jgi:two-component system chemotaxis sensor kinase CheA